MSAHRDLLRELFERNEKGFNEEEQVNYLVYQIVDRYRLKSIAVLFYTGEHDHFEVFAHRGLSRNFIKFLYSSGENRMITEAREREVVVTRAEPRSSSRDYTFEHDTSFRYAMPIKYCGKTLGILYVDGNDEGVVSQGVIEDFHVIGGIVGFYLKVKRLSSQISRVPDIDPLTGLYSFKYFHEALFREITRSESMSHPMSLLFMEMRNIREMNRIYGHVKGDTSIVVLSQRVKNTVRGIDVAARSGDNFYVVMPEVDIDGATKITKGLKDSLDRKPVGEGEVHLQLAMGLVSYPAHGGDERVLIGRAERLVYESKRKGGNAISRPDD